jgi:beta-lactamase regulating signal transducer with metallopeptidase domain/protein involved in polysaccharide export with SLBB domain
MTSLFEAGLINAAVVSVLAVAVWLVTRRWRHPALVHTLWVIVLVKLLTPPMVTIPWRFPHATPPTSALPAHGDVALTSHRDELVDQSDRRPGEQTAALADPSLSDPLPVPHPGPGEGLAGPVDLPTAPDSVEEKTSATRLESAVNWRTAFTSAIPWTTLAMSAWLLGSGIFVVVSALRMVRFHRALANTRPVPNAIHQVAEAVTARFGLTGRYQLRMTEARLPPLVWPLGRPTIVMPATLVAELSPDEIQTLLAHELAHLRRHDHWVRWLELVVSAMYWWHPVVWWARIAIQQAEEEACDAWVVSALPDSAVRYASALFKAAQLFSEDRQTQPALASALRSGGELKERIEHIMNTTWQAPLRIPVRLSVLLFALLVLPLSLRAVRATDELTPADEPDAAADQQEERETDADTVATEKVAPTAEIADFPNTAAIDPGNGPPQSSAEDSSHAAAADPYGNSPAGPLSPDPKPVPKASDRAPENRDVADARGSRIQFGTVVAINVAGAPAEHPINDSYLVQSDGNVALGPVYGRVKIDGMTIEEAESAVVAHLSKVLRDPRVQITWVNQPVVPGRVPVPADPYRIATGDVLAVSVINALANQPIDGDYVVEPSGSLPLGPTYGRVNVAGMTLEDAEKAVTAHLGKILEDPELQITIGGWRGRATSFANPTPDSRADPFAATATSSESTPYRANQQQRQRPANAEALEAMRQHVQFLENHFKKVEALNRNGLAGGEAHSLALAGYELAAAQGELALTGQNRVEARTRFEEAEKYAEQALVAAQAARAAAQIQDDALLQAARNLAEIRRRLSTVRYATPSAETAPSEAIPHRDGTFQERTPVAIPSSTTESLGVLRKIAERAQLDYHRVKELAEQKTVSATEVARAKSDFEISLERVRQAERGLKYHELLLEAAEADYQMLSEANRVAPNTVPQLRLRKAKLAVELARAKLEELSE